jgi:TonB-linked SusC/RagA family outer membrane protein
MKKIYENTGEVLLCPSVLKLLLTMKLTLLLICGLGLLTSIAENTYAQTARITLDLRDASVKDVLSYIEDNSEFSFMYDNKDINVNRKVNIIVNDETIGSILEQLFAKEQIISRIIGKHIIILPEHIVAKENAADLLQQGHVTGKVIDETGEPLPGVTVIVKGTMSGTVTGVDGNYSISNIPIDATLKFSFVGMKTQEIEVGNKSNIDVALLPDAIGLEEVVAIGYGTQRKSDITGAVASVRVDDISANASRSVSSAIQGRIAGVAVESAGGAPGAGTNITIRGLSSVGNNTPLYIVDGVFLSNMKDVSPNDIESIEILKDAATASIYGSRAANGVVIITTKSGKKNTGSKVEVDSWIGVQSIPKRMDLLSGEEWTNLMNDNVGGIPDYNGINTDWQDEIFQAATVVKTNLNFSGGTEHFIYNLSTGYLKENGTIRKTDYSMANFRVKTQYEKGRVRIGETVMIRRRHSNNDVGGGDQTGSLIGSALAMPATVPVYDEDYDLGGFGHREDFMKNLSNPIARIESIDNESNALSLVANAFLELRLIDELKYKFNVGLTENRGMTYVYTGVYNDGNVVNELPDLSEGTSINNSWLIENTLNYDKLIGKHKVTALAGYTMQRNSYRGISAERLELAVGTSVIDAGDVTTKDNSGSAWANSMASYLGRVMYAYDSKYMLTASVRRDGSSRFNEEYRYGTFPSVSIGWNIHNEDFFTQNTDLISNLKLRASWGVLGNQEIGNYSTVNGVNYNMNYVQGGELWLGAIPTSYASPVDLTWEETKTINLGLDAGFWDNKLYVVVDVFHKKTDGVLLAVPFPNSVGKTGSPTLNAGVVENKGLEVAINFTDNIGKLKYRIGINGSKIKNEMTAITIGSGTQEFGDFSKAKVGYPIGAFFLVKTDGIFNSVDEVNAHNKDGQLIQPNAQPGDIRFVDYNDDGEINNVDRQHLGNPIPKFNLGLNTSVEWKGFDASLFFDGVFGNKIYNSQRIWMEKMVEVVNFSSDVLNAWTENNKSDFPRFTFSDPNDNKRESDRWLEDGSFFRLKRLELGYTIPKKILEKAGIDGLRLYCSGENLFTLTKYSGYNPDIGMTEGTLTRGIDSGEVYPLSRTFLFGFNLTF